MNEYLVEWTLLRERNYLQECISLPLANKVCQQFTTAYGRIDFAHKIKNDGFLITELETIIDSKAKLSYCLQQSNQYTNIILAKGFQHKVGILFAKQTPVYYTNEIVTFCDANDLLWFDYDLDKIRLLYDTEIQKALINNGVPLSPPISLNFTHLGGLNRLFVPFYENNADRLAIKDFGDAFNFSDGVTKTRFNVAVRVAEDFDLLNKVRNTIQLTDFGVRFRDNINAVEITDKLKRINLSVEQKRILLESLLNGNFYEKKCKINIYYFLKFIALTDGEWLPRGRAFQKKSEFDFVNSFFKMDYTEGTVADVLRFSCNHCEELELTEKVKTSGFYDRVIFTSLGSRILQHLESDIQHKRERIQIPLQI
ncbi:MAG: hypothetical protein LBO69_09245 [Ignavibacteria bacterium]|jgi:hypothetical protein|nr:hypothetical protein [Ignavibacteria bacterium]